MYQLWWGVTNWATVRDMAHVFTLPIGDNALANIYDRQLINYPAIIVFNAYINFLILITLL